MKQAQKRPMEYGVKRKSATSGEAHSTEALEKFFSVADAIATLLIPQAEVVIHDLISGRIAYVANNISRRKVGESSLTDLKDIGSLEENVIGPYRKTNFDGRELKSVTAVLRESGGRPYGLVCINFDVAMIEAARNILTALSALDDSSKQPQALFRSDWQETVNRAIANYLKERGIAASALAKEDHAEIIRALDKEGYFAIRNLVPYVARLFGISRATVYKHLKDVRRPS